jgi:hypothetical protein
MLRVGIVAEGPSDWFALEEFMRVLHPAIEFVHLSPDPILGARAPTGWKNVRAWCREFGPHLEVFMTGIPGQPLHLLVIHVDCSMAHNENAERPCPPASDTAHSLREVVIGTWLNRNPKPSFLILATPSKTTEAWIAPTLDPPHPNLGNIECDLGAEDELALRRLLPRKDGAVKKQARRYRPLAEQIGVQINRVCDHCSQASSFRHEFSLAACWVDWMVSPV